MVFFYKTMFLKFYTVIDEICLASWLFVFFYQNQTGGPRTGVQYTKCSIRNRSCSWKMTSPEAMSSKTSKNARGLWSGSNFLGVGHPKARHSSSTCCWCEFSERVVCGWWWSWSWEWRWTRLSKGSRWWTQWGGCQIQKLISSRIRMAGRDILAGWLARSWFVSMFRLDWAIQPS